MLSGIFMVSFQVSCSVEYADKVQEHDIRNRHPAFRASSAIVKRKVLFPGYFFGKFMELICFEPLFYYDVFA